MQGVGGECAGGGRGIGCVQEVGVTGCEGEATSPCSSVAGGLTVWYPGDLCCQPSTSFVEVRVLQHSQPLP